MSTTRYITNHVRVFRLIKDNPTMTVRNIAGSLGITERTVMSILNDLKADGYIETKHIGRNTRKRVIRDLGS